ncbi:undecaprenyl-diphosphatase UppP [Halothermothrix orenii]|uniref:Undecaprenyl-diphosphatase n=1 Tax=Halothermothrix orenii (strain H 168 / OCM 544 / DSM 9562) TaxID=373903 RepID=UPPP_HALOH|nr:undecaprenyl-diphosphatase UppP [Halothermothrix orenii]B8CWG2.1 RecName: Full=Undecaprenyl-diphosphatase; AltName: Full=Bacitracin resistance protein; AltName: Full=Undecaprenyl pyrophosphate phosphatase [Halothermothrix orenii H 168]ACL69631.1 putative undecaprenol kinase [Halothermothrix orenii H 168]
MEIFKVIFLGIIQGLTEFLPISSSGHLVLFQELLGINTDQITLDVFLHFGTVIPVLIIFWDDVRDIIFFKKEKRWLTILILVGIIPTGIIGILFEDFFANLFSSVKTVGFMLLVTGFLLYLSEKLSNYNKELKEMQYHNALIVGVAQGMAIIPGISRSGSTIVASLLQGFDRDAAARYSFLLSAPVIFGAGLVELKDALSTGLEQLTWLSIIIGTIFAALSGYFAIKYLLYILRKGKLTVFAYYCWIVGIMIIILAGIF